jgi:hypothetical protein
MTLRQKEMLELVEELGGMTTDQALERDQTTFGSCCAENSSHRRWLKYDLLKKKFVLSHDGKEDLYEARHIELTRKHNNGRFSVRVPRFGAKVQSIRSTAA